MARSRRKKDEASVGAIFVGLLIFVGIVINYPSLFLFMFFLVLGIIAFVIYRKFKRHQMIRNSSISEIDVMDGLVFENYLSVLFDSLGYKTSVTRSTGDFGADVILKKDSRVIAVQAKRYSKKVGVSAVQQIVGAKNIYKADELWVVTNNYYTQQAQQLAKANNVRLLDRDDIIQLTYRVNAKK